MTKSEAQNGAVWCDVVAEVVELLCGAVWWPYWRRAVQCGVLPRTY